MTEERIEKNKEEFIKIFTENIKRDGAEDLLKYLVATDFFIAPTSTKYHLAEDGGLCQHSLNVYKRLLKIVKRELGNKFEETYNLETLAIVGLLHDMCKIHLYKKDFKNVKVDGQWVKEPIYVADERLHFGHGSKSVFMIQQFMRMFVEEAVAIRYHMGGLEYPTANFVEPFVPDVYNQYPLALFIHMADLEATYIDERVKPNDK